jgi:hypothetical protein
VTSMPAMRPPLLALLLVSACAAGATTTPPQAAPAATMDLPPPTATTAAVAPPVVASASASPEPVGAPEPPLADPCRGSAFDLDSLPACKTHQGSAPDSQTAKLAVALVPETPTVRSGEVLGVSVVFTNKGRDPLPVDVKTGCSQFELGAFDRRGIRRDYVVKDCGFGTGCGGAVSHLVVDPGGTITKHLHFKARVTNVTAKSDCKDVDGGGLPPGKYTLRATAMLNDWLDGAPTLESTRVTAPIEVTR